MSPTFWLAGLIFVIPTLAFILTLKRKPDEDEHATHPGATAPGLPHNRSKKQTRGHKIIS